MSSVTVATRHLVGLLADAALTACQDPELPALCAVLLSCDRGEWATTEDSEDSGEPLINVIPSDLLVASSTDRMLAAQAHTACEGRLHEPVLVNLAEVKAIVAVFKPLIGSLGKETTHRCVLEYSASAQILEVREDPQQVQDGSSLSVPLLDTELFPSLWKVMEPDVTRPVGGPDGAVVEPSYGTGVTSHVLEVFGKVAKRRKMPVAWYRHHQSRGVVVEIGAAYRAVFQPVKLEDYSDRHLAPMVRVFSPVLAQSQPVKDEPLVPA